MTSQIIAIGFVAVALFVGSMTAHAADLDAGVKAHERGDYTTAIQIFQQLANQGNASAQNALGNMYHDGKGVPQDYAVAVGWYQNAADQGDAEAQYSLGLLYEKGRGVTQNYVLAHIWYNLAAAQSQKFAKKSRDNLAEKMNTAQIAEAQRLAREWKPKGK